MHAGTDGADASEVNAWPPPWPAAGSELAEQFEQVLGVTVARATDPRNEPRASTAVPVDHRERPTQAAAQPTLPPPVAPSTAPVSRGGATLAPRPTASAGSGPAPFPGPPAGDRPPMSPQWPPTLAARHCRAGHPNPPAATACRACGSPIEDLSVQVIDRPVLGELHLADGSVIALDEPLLLGRNPAADHLVFGRTARPVRLADARGVLSRNHLEIRAVQWQVQVVDQGSTNGSSLRSADGTVHACPPGVPVELVPGTSLVLGAQVTLEFRAVLA